MLCNVELYGAVLCPPCITPWAISDAATLCRSQLSVRILPT